MSQKTSNLLVTTLSHRFTFKAKISSSNSHLNRRLSSPTYKKATKLSNRSRMYRTKCTHKKITYTTGRTMALRTPAREKTPQKPQPQETAGTTQQASSTKPPTGTTIKTERWNPRGKAIYPMTTNRKMERNNCKGS